MATHGVDRNSTADGSGSAVTPLPISVVDAKGDLIAGTANDAVTRVPVGSNNQRLVADSAQTSGLKYVDDTQNTVVDAKGDLLAGTADNTVARLAVGSDNQALLADSSQSTGLRWGGVATGAPTVRQTQLAGKVDSNGYNNTLSAGAGLNFNVAATTTAVVLAFANGFDSGGSTDTYTQLTADASNQGSLNANNTHYISATRSSSSAVTWGQYLVPPDYAYAFDRTRGALLNFEGSNASTTTTDDFGNAWTASGNAQITTAQSKFGTSCTVLDGTGDFWTTTNITSFGDSSWEVSLWFRINALPGAGANATLFSARNTTSTFGLDLGLNNTAGTTKMFLNASSNNVSYDIANVVLGSNTAWTLNQWNKVRLVFDALAGTYRVYLSLNAGAETQEISVSSSAKIQAVNGMRIGATHDAGTSGFNGWIDAFRFIRAATVTATETPGVVAPAITDYPYHWFSIPEMKMYEVTSASASAGTNPGMTRRDRVFVGEADTGAATVSAVRNYALRGEYVSAWTAYPTTSGTVSHTTNLGTTEARAAIQVKVFTTTGGFSVGDVFEHPWSGSGTDPQMPHPWISRNSAGFGNGAANAIAGTPKSGGALAAFNAAGLAYRMVVKRAF